MVDFKKYTVLVVEDDNILRNSFCNCLKMLFLKVFEAADGEDGLKQYNANSPDIVITDIYLPKMNGTELVGLIRESDSDTPILLMSSHSDPDTFIKTMPIAVSGYMIKPFSFESCLENLKKCVQKIERRQPEALLLKSGAVLDTTTGDMTYKNTITALTAQEFALVKILLKSPNTTATQKNIVNGLWGGEQKSPSALKNLILKVRKKLGNEAIDTIVGYGYRLNIKH